jgi:Domain of unknown function (DUF4192)
LAIGIHRCAGGAHDLAARTQTADMAASRKSAHRKSRPKKSGLTKSGHRSSARRKALQRPRAQPPQAQTRLTIRQPDDLLAVIPYLIGFHPDESLVVVFITSGRVKLAARLDMPPESAGDELAESIDLLANQHQADALALVAYSAASLPANRLLTRLMDRLGEHELSDVLYVGHGRWWSLTCGEECCPLSGRPFDLTSHPLSAAAVLAGLGACANRRELEASVRGPSQVDLPRLQSLAESLPGGADELGDAGGAVGLLASVLDDAMADLSDLDERTCLLLGLLMRDIQLRDHAWALISPATADDHVRLWGGVVSRVPPMLAAAPLCLLGMAAWLSGAGALLNCCCERLSVVAPGYSMGRLLAEIGARALPPSLWKQIGGEIQAGLPEELAPLAG